MRVENSVEISAPVSRVWELTIDLESWPEHTPTITHVERLDGGPIEVGSQARVKQPVQSAKVWIVTELEPEKTFTWTTRAMGMTMIASHQLEETEAGTRNHLSVETTGGLSSLLGGLIKGSIGKAIARENMGFKEAAEA